MQNAVNMNHTGVLDMKDTNDRVPRKKWERLMQNRLNDTQKRMIALTPQPLVVKSKGDGTNTTAEITKEVTQGSLMSPTQSSIYMKNFVEALEGSISRRHVRETNATAILACSQMI